MVPIQRVDPGGEMGPRKPDAGACVIGVEREGLLQQTPHLVELCRPEG